MIYLNRATEGLKALVIYLTLLTLFALQIMKLIGFIAYITNAMLILSYQYISNKIHLYYGIRSLIATSLHVSRTNFYAVISCKPKISPRNISP